MSRVQAGGFAPLLVLAIATVAVATGGGTAAAAPPADTVVEADAVEFRITVFENGSARWTFTYTRFLENETERDRFTAFARTFRENETEAYRQFRGQARALAAAGRNATGREMTAEDFGRSAGLGGECVTTSDCGTIRMSFLWTAFAAREDGRLVVGDVFGSGLFLSEDQQLVFETGSGLGFDSASPASYVPSGSSLDDSDAITYEGEQTFSDNRPRVVLVPAEATADTATGTAGSASPTGDGESPPAASGGSTLSSTSGAPGSSGSGDLPMTLLGGILAVLIGAGAALVWWRGDGGAVVTPDSPGEDGGAPVAESEDAAAGEPAVPEEELLTDEDRVLKLLEDNGGRMKQVDIVDETGWSKSKVSMLLSDMAEEDQISKLRVGRENIISLAGHEPEAAGSPHEED